MMKRPLRMAYMAEDGEVYCVSYLRLVPRQSAKTYSHTERCRLTSNTESAAT